MGLIDDAPPVLFSHPYHSHRIQSQSSCKDADLLVAVGMLHSNNTRAADCDDRVRKSRSFTALPEHP